MWYARSVGGSEGVHAAEVAQHALADVVDAAERERVALRHAPRVAPHPSDGNARVVEVRDLAVSHRIERRRAYPHPDALGVDASAVRYEAVVDRVPSRAARVVQPRHALARPGLLRRAGRADAHSPGARLRYRAMLDAVRYAALAQPHSVFAAFRYGAAAKRHAQRAVRQHRRLRLRRRLGGRPLARRPRPWRVRELEADVLEHDVVDAGARRRVTRDAQQRRQSRHGVLDSRILRRLARLRDIDDFPPRAVVEPFAGLVERRRRVFDAIHRLRVPRVPSRYRAAFRDRHVVRRVVCHDLAARDRPFVVDGQLAEPQLRPAARGEQREIAVRRFEFHQFHSARQKRGLCAFDAQEARVRMARALRPPPVDVKLLEPDDFIAVVRFDDRRVGLPPAVFADFPAFEIARAGHARHARAGRPPPYHGRAARAGIAGNERPWLFQNVFAGGQFDSPSAPASFRRHAHAQGFLRLSQTGERALRAPVARPGPAKRAFPRGNDVNRALLPARQCRPRRRNGACRHCNRRFRNLPVLVHAAYFTIFPLAGVLPQS